MALLDRQAHANRPVPAVLHFHFAFDGSSCQEAQGRYKIMNGLAGWFQVHRMAVAKKKEIHESSMSYYFARQTSIHTYGLITWYVHASFHAHRPQSFASNLGKRPGYRSCKRMKLSLHDPWEAMRWQRRFEPCWAQEGGKRVGRPQMQRHHDQHCHRWNSITSTQASSIHGSHIRMSASLCRLHMFWAVCLCISWITGSGWSSMQLWQEKQSAASVACCLTKFWSHVEIRIVSGDFLWHFCKILAWTLKHGDFVLSAPDSWTQIQIGAWVSKLVRYATATGADLEQSRCRSSRWGRPCCWAW